MVFGYLAQGHGTEPPHLTPIEFIRNAKPMFQEDAVSLLGRFLFRYEQMQQPVSARCRVASGAQARSAC